MEKLQTLPIGDSSFDSIRSNNCLYVDKTRHIFNLADQGKYYFIARPRRFGKSLMVSTLRCMFKGRKELFEGLHVSKTGWEWKKHPVILLDFNSISHDTTENLKLSLKETLLVMAEQEGIELKSSLLKGQFKELICRLYKKTKMPVVILIDEYDKPLIDYLGKGKEHLDIAKENRDILKTFFGVMKEGDVASVLRFVFITGVSRFSRVSIFSELNNLDDITMNRHYSEMLGYTQEELETCFSDHINRFAQEQTQSSEKIIEQLKNYYNGYRFSERDVRVYTPFSVLKALNERAFKNFWFETGTPTFLVNLLKEKQWHVPEIEGMQATEAVFSTYDLDNLKPEALMFQTGYTTIQNVMDRLYEFGYPNQEVKTAFLENLFHSYTQGFRNSSQFVLLAGCLQKEDINSFIETMTAIYASIPYTLETKRDEAYFHTIFYLMVCASGVNAHSEVLTSKGRIDLLVEFSDKLYIIEFKCNQSADAAIKQIKDRGYDKKYMNTGKKIMLMGINFDTEKRNISEWKCV
ncbi:AAA ATPase-like domain-containing protein, nuclease domain-containing [Desulfonema limicola]|uniref:AAA ATPase-like domain-containing protein, nuclease domain-containing n=1 Tax=Desulfonema limicola TaxID=45656 RepID=A0A975GGI0_9BACT|nr:ATP-binding protein [Desulfonema limicola]QTA80340.1 AAA ATPase-like domain-containing protein, nuclease domain-containing [Desulfonema limicola]